LYSPKQHNRLRNNRKGWSVALPFIVQDTFFVLPVAFPQHFAQSFVVSAGCPVNKKPTFTA